MNRLRQKFLLIVALLTAGLVSAFPAAYALETLRFQEIDTPRLQSLFQGRQDITIAPIDLNEDGLDEFIVKPKMCAKECDFTVMAENGNNGQLIALGTLKGRELLPGNAYSHGVRHLLLFDDPNNDYSYSVYVWAAERSRYMMKERVYGNHDQE
ncbi:MAG: hypothetical protein R3D66_05965 [Alphaproteobacteria bacterium]